MGTTPTTGSVTDYGIPFLSAAWAVSKCINARSLSAVAAAIGTIPGKNGMDLLLTALSTYTPSVYIPDDPEDAGFISSGFITLGGQSVSWIWSNGAENESYWEPG